MAENIGSRLSVDWFGLQTDIVDVSDWTISQDPDSPQTRSDIISAIMHNHSHDHLQNILKTGWDVNEVLNMPAHLKYRRSFGDGHWRNPMNINKLWVPSTALHEAAKRDWTEGVKMLLDAGAKCKVSGALENPLTLALEHHDCHPELIELLLTHGADPNDHDGVMDNIPLFKAIQLLVYNNVNSSQIVHLLLMHKADPNITFEQVNEGSLCPLIAVINLFTMFMYIGTEHGNIVPEHQLLEFRNANTQLFNTLLTFGGADVNWKVDHSVPLLHKLLGEGAIYHMFRIMPPYTFLPEHLDLFFQHGGNINVKHGEYITALLHAVTNVYTHSNNIRWLIKHGVDVSRIRVSLFKNNVQAMPFANRYSPDTPLILLQAGMRVSHGAQTQLRNMETAITAWLQKNTAEYRDIIKTIRAMWEQLKKAEQEDARTRQHVYRKTTFPEYWTQQMADLQEFSDESLQVYPDVNYGMHATDIRTAWQYAVDQINTMLGFLSQPQSLEWYCRRSVRENLVSLQPSVVKTLPGPAILKRYVLCHEI